MARAVITAWLKQGRVVEAGGLEKAQDPRSHSHHYRTYRKVR